MKRLGLLTITVLALCLLGVLALVLQPPARLLITSSSSQANTSYSTLRKALLSSSSSSSSSSCNIFEGAWVAGDDEGYPLYKPGSCPFVEDSFSCSANGRPDSGFAHWRWLPLTCRIPRFNARNLLEHLRGKRLVFVGDSLSRNQWESMLCLLIQALPNQSRLGEVNGPFLTMKNSSAFHFHFQDYDCHLEYYSSHFLVEEEYNTSTSRLEALKLDRLHSSHTHWKNADVLVFTTGHWWTRGKTARGMNFYREEDHLYPKLNLMVAFTKALQTWAKWVDNHVNYKTRVFLVGYSPGHFRGGKWNTGGECQSATWPIKDASQIPKYPEKMVAIERIVRDMKFPVKILNITGLSSSRIDGHPSVYGLRNAHGYQDCSHWCLPGVPDVWNVLLYALLLVDFDEKAVNIA